MERKLTGDDWNWWLSENAVCWKSRFGVWSLMRACLFFKVRTGAFNSRLCYPASNRFDFDNAETFLPVIRCSRFSSGLSVSNVWRLIRQEGSESLILSWALRRWCNQKETGAMAVLLCLTDCHDVTAADQTILTFLLIRLCASMKGSMWAIRGRDAQTCTHMVFV